MASVEEIQKVNELAQELLKNKVATSLDDAMNKAQNILSICLGPKVDNTNRQIDGVVQKEETPQSHAIEQPVKQKEESVVKTNAPSDYLTRAELQQEIQQLKQTLNMSFKKLYEEIQKTITTNNDALMSTIKTNKVVATPSAPQQQQQAKQQESNVEQITIEETPENKEEESHPKQGNYQPGDANVDIRKIFYFGNK